MIIPISFTYRTLSLAQCTPDLNIVVYRTFVNNILDQATVEDEVIDYSEAFDNKGESNIKNLLIDPMFVFFLV